MIFNFFINGLIMFRWNNLYDAADSLQVCRLIQIYNAFILFENTYKVFSQHSKLLVYSVEFVLGDTDAGKGDIGQYRKSTTFLFDFLKVFRS